MPPPPPRVSTEQETDATCRVSSCHPPSVCVFYLKYLHLEGGWGGGDGGGSCRYCPAGDELVMAMTVRTEREDEGSNRVAANVETCFVLVVLRVKREEEEEEEQSGKEREKWSLCVCV